jgi:hypothetical protein
MVREIRIQDYVWENLSDTARLRLKELFTRYAGDYGYETFYNYFWIKFTEAGWFLAQLADPEIMSMIERPNGKTYSKDY